MAQSRSRRTTVELEVPVVALFDDDDDVAVTNIFLFWPLQNTIKSLSAWHPDEC